VSKKLCWEPTTIVENKKLIWGQKTFCEQKNICEQKKWEQKIVVGDIAFPLKPSHSKT
jgi:hypothetical protein